MDSLKEERVRGELSEAEKFEFDAWPSFSNCGIWRMFFPSEFGRGPNRPTRTMPWMNVIEKAKKFQVLPISRSITGTAMEDFETPDDKTASGFDADSLRIS